MSPPFTVFWYYLRCKGMCATIAVQQSREGGKILTGWLSTVRALLLGWTRGGRLLLLPIALLFLWGIIRLILQRNKGR